MAQIRVRDISMYYEESGPAGGEPVLLIAGLSLNTTTWYRQAPALAERYRIIAFDNRGAGRSDKPEQEYTIALFADDTAALTDALGMDSAHLCGMSMGGMIAQEVALRHPSRVRSLMLLCTTPGGRDAAPPAASLSDPANAGLTPAEIFDRSLPWFYSDAWGQTHRDEVLQRAQQNAHLRVSPAEFMRQLGAIRGRDDGTGGHDTVARLSRITAPALVLAGAEDPLVPVANSRRLAQDIPGARYIEYAGGRHYFHIERADEVNTALLTFLDEVTSTARAV